MFDLVRAELKSILVDLWKYFNIIPPHVENEKLFQYIVHSNRMGIERLTRTYPYMDCRVLETLAVNLFLQKKDKEIIDEYKIFTGELRNGE